MVFVSLHSCNAGRKVLEKFCDIVLLHLSGLTETVMRLTEFTRLGNCIQYNGRKHNDHEPQKDGSAKLETGHCSLTLLIMVFYVHEKLRNLPWTQTRIINQRILLGDPEVMEGAIHILIDKRLSQNR